MANLVSNYKNFKGESAPAKMAILDGTSTMDSMILVSMFYVQRIENGSLGRKRRYFACFVCQVCHKTYGNKVCQQSLFRFFN